jgi:hypothetical protein
MTLTPLDERAYRTGEMSAPAVVSQSLLGAGYCVR